MIICICNWVSDKEIQEIKNFADVKSVPELQCIMKICNNCCTCVNQIEEILNDGYIKKYNEGRKI